MRENDGRKIDHATLEAIRIRAAKQIDAGAHPDDVAVSLGLNRSTVYGWVAKYRAGGEAALLAKPLPGPEPKLSAQHHARLYALIRGGDPRQLELDLVLWTRKSVRELILREFDVKLSEVSVGRLLRKMGMSPQRPTYRSYEADPAAQETWTKQIFPQIQEEAKRIGAVILFGDEASVRSDFHSGTTWAPVGRTPVVTATGKRVSVNMVSAISPRGELHFKLIDGSMNSAQFIAFCDDLCHDIPDRTIFLIVDGVAYHHSKAVKKHLATLNAERERIRVIKLPAYSPHLNPDEWVWRNVKGHRIGRMQILDRHTLHSAARDALQRLKAAPEIVRGFFHDPNLAYIKV
jgi:transposase